MLVTLQALNKAGADGLALLLCLFGQVFFIQCRQYC
jgi:hypothetical protein